MTSQQKFEMLMRDTTVTGNWDLFQKTAREVLDKTGMCPGSGNNIEGRLAACAQNKPEDFAAVSNSIRAYFEWANTELRTIRDLYRDKLTSPLMRDRVEARLAGECMRREMANKDTSSALNVCRDPKNWPVEKTFYASCSTAGNTSSSSFGYKQYLSDCVIGQTVRTSLGAALAHSMVPDFKLEVTAEGVTTTTSPLTEVPSTAYHAIYNMVYSYISSDWYNAMATKGCLPSVFAPANFGSLSADERAKYYAVCIPTGIIQQISALPRVDADFFRSAIARRIATIQTVEMLNGALMIMQDAQRSLNIADREIGTLADANVQLLQKYVDAYNRSIDLTFSQKLDDVVKEVQSMVDKYNTEIKDLDRGQQSIRNELVELKKKQKTGE